MILIKGWKKVKSIEKVTQFALRDAKAWDSYITSHNTFKEALKHDCFYDIINQNNETVTIAFLPISTSENKVSCGLQKFNKIHLLTNYNKKFYITRILFHKTMTKEEFEKWEANSKLWYQDLTNNNYSLLKDTDLVKSNLGFFTKELPLVKFKFTDLAF